MGQLEVKPAAAMSQREKIKERQSQSETGTEVAPPRVSGEMMWLGSAAVGATLRSNSYIQRQTESRQKGGQWERWWDLGRGTSGYNWLRIGGCRIDRT